MYIIIDLDTGKCAAVDPCDASRLCEALDQLSAAAPQINVALQRRAKSEDFYQPDFPPSLSLDYALITHRHLDHSGGNRLLKSLRPSVQIVCGRREPCVAADRLMDDGQTLMLGTTQLQCILTPCHTYGHLVWTVNAPQCGLESLVVPASPPAHRLGPHITRQDTPKILKLDLSEAPTPPPLPTPSPLRQLQCERMQLVGSIPPLSPDTAAPTAGPTTPQVWPHKHLSVLMVATEVAPHLDHRVRGEPELPPQTAVFTGDTLFVGGCGMFFEGSPAEMRQNFGKLCPFLQANGSSSTSHERKRQNGPESQAGGANVSKEAPVLAESTWMYPGHDYALKNAEFATWLNAVSSPPHAPATDPAADVQRLKAWAHDARMPYGVPLLPTTLGDEGRVNVFLRHESPAVQDRVQAALTSSSHPRVQQLAQQFGLVEAQGGGGGGGSGDVGSASETGLNVDDSLLGLRRLKDTFPHKTCT